MQKMYLKFIKYIPPPLKLFFSLGQGRKQAWQEEGKSRDICEVSQKGPYPHKIH